MRIRQLQLTFLLLALGMPTFAEEPPDPFAPDEPKAIDRSADKNSEHFIGDETLKEFQEERLDKGIEKNRLVVRIKVWRSFHAPLMFKWSATVPGDESVLCVKRLKSVVSEDGKTTYKGLDLDQEIKLLPGQTRLLKTLYARAPIHELPQPYWTELGLDGSDWTYEVASDDGLIIIARRNPVYPTLEGTKLEPERLLHEMQVTSFALMLWALSGIDDEPY